jgi:hypothetical protein
LKEVIHMECGSHTQSNPSLVKLAHFCQNWEKSG